MCVSLDREYLKGFVDEKDYEKIYPQLEKAHNELVNKSGKGSDFTGWNELPSRIEDTFLDEIVDLGKDIRQDSDCLLSLGIGGSYLGVKASVEFLIAEQKLPLYFAGHNLSSGYLFHLLKNLQDKRVTVVVISKSGTTTETALAFRIVNKFMEEKYSSDEIKKRIICITDKHKGALRQKVNKSGWRSFPIADDVGGRFSIFTPAGLVPLAIAGVDVKGMVEGARIAQKKYTDLNLDTNTAYQYAAARYCLYKMGKKIEVLSTFYQRLSYVGEWWKQLFGESEGKDGQGIYPSSLSFTTDLHSMGQYMQEGERNMFETFLLADNSNQNLIIPEDAEDLDAFNCVAGKDLDYVNKQAYKATAMAHYEGGVPNLTITIPDFSAKCLGHLYYFFEKAVAIVGYLLDVNPFNQPGVEAYKKNMFKLLGKK